jgi:dTDP-4-amino-4,6-dideoxygalactose transaminase
MILPASPVANYLAHQAEIDQAIRRVLDGGIYILGQEVSAFEEEFARYLGAQNAIGVGSGTDALHVALRACGVGPGDAVLTVSHTAVATVAAIELTGAMPVLIDVEPITATLDVNRLEDVIKKPHPFRIKAIVPVHLYGHPAEMPAIMGVAERHGLTVIEDCAQSHGAALNGRKTGTFGHLAAFSFYPTKNLGALGDGGAVVTNDQHLAEQLRLLREYGWRQRYVSHLAGLNTRLDELQAAILRAKLPYLDKENERRRTLARIYDAALSNTLTIIPRSQRGAEHAYHQYVVRTDSRDDLRSFLKDEGVGTLIHYPVPVHLQPAYQGRIVLDHVGLPETETICRQILSLPMHPQLTDAEAGTVAHLIARWSGQSSQARGR